MIFLVSVVVQVEKNSLDGSNKEFSWTSYKAVKQISSKLHLKSKHTPMEIPGDGLFDFVKKH